MPIRVSCPECKKELSTPDTLIGKTVACPRCKHRFTADGNVSVTVTSAASVAADDRLPPEAPTAPPAPSPVVSSQTRAKSFLQPPTATQSSPPPASVPTPASPSSPANVPPSATPVASAVAASAPPVAEPPQPGSAIPPRSAVPVAIPAVANRPSLDPPIAPPAKPKEVVRTAHAAKFISADPNEARIQLGADGQLPQLVLVKGQKEGAEVESTSSASPVMLAVVLAVSLGMTGIMLLFDFEMGPSDSTTKAAARAQIERYYIGRPPDGKDSPPNQVFKEYQILLRRALRSHNRGDRNQERQLYRQVLNILHAEGRGTLMGVTGMIGATTPPNDDHLEKQLSLLLD